MTSDTNPSSWRRRSWWLWIGYWLGLFVVMHVPVGGKGPPPPEYADKAVHFGLYFGLVWLGGRHLLAAGRNRVSRIIVAWMVFYAVYAALDEWLQQFVGRTMSAADWVADIAGIAAATIVLLARKRPSTLSEPGEMTQ